MRFSIAFLISIMICNGVIAQITTAEIQRLKDQQLQKFRQYSLIHQEIPLTKPWLKGRLIAESNYSRISVKASDEQDFVSIDVFDLRNWNDEYNNLDSNRWLTKKPQISFIENNNVVTIQEKSNQKTGLIISITVPEKFNAKIKTREEQIFVFDLDGEIEAESEKGDITLVRIDGSAVVNTVSGNINAGYKEVSPKYPHALSSEKGNIKLVIPGHASVNIIIGIEKGDIESDFRMTTHRNTDDNGGHDIKMIQLGQREASIGITSYYGDVNIYKSGN